MTKCPNCQKSLTGMFGATMVSDARLALINKFSAVKSDAYCDSCSAPVVKKINAEFSEQKKSIQIRLNKIISNIPVITSPSPVKWEYEVLQMVSAQTTMGTGVLMELGRGFSDFFGGGSSATNEKIANATNQCQNELRAKCAKAGGNAVVSTDIDFSEVSNGMLLVCMAGTAIRVLDVNNFNPKKRVIIGEIGDLIEKLYHLSEIPI